MCIDNGKKYGHLRNLVKGLPMNSPVSISISPEYCIQVTLIDANHCIGSCMFLIEDHKKSILYTGDIRVDSNFLASLSKQPVVLPYIVNKKLDTIYIDTTFSIRSEPYTEIPPNIQGIIDIIQIIQLYPEETRFYLNTSTAGTNSDCISGYEDIWLYLASAYKAKVHVNLSQYLLFENLSSFNNKGSFPFSSYFTGRSNTEKVNQGCLTTQGSDAKFHSCKREECEFLKDDNHSQPVVFVQPVVDKTSAEIWSQNRARSLESFDSNAIDTPNSYAQFLDGCHENIKGRSAYYIIAENEIYIKSSTPTGEIKLLPTNLYIPFSKHSSFFEMRELVRLFRPNDVYPCVLPNQPGGKDFRAIKAWLNGFSILRLFGSECRNLGGYRFDQEMKEFVFLQQQRGFNLHAFPSQLEKICSGEVSSEDDQLNMPSNIHKSDTNTLSNRRMLNGDPRNAKFTMELDNLEATEVRLRRAAQATKLPPFQKKHFKGKGNRITPEELTNSSSSSSSVSELLVMLNRFNSQESQYQDSQCQNSKDQDSKKETSYVLKKSYQGRVKASSTLADTFKSSKTQTRATVSSSQSESFSNDEELKSNETDIDELSDLLSSVLVPKKKARKQAIHIGSKTVRKVCKSKMRSGGLNSSPSRGKIKLERKASLNRNNTANKGPMVRKSWKLDHV
ncbi:hypothetical protein NADFUDRAFT_53690 [Nadsonia fulvescens var. elongata DSM 6958]|uniref:Protein artemis n=1 Tax=Nadsonia fulvescens var. elongata DSM 6958 TaxID=857566 RepID=A0A1E3PDD9_9ASCO|nr:hypothetical protein NADFUDRAFT_53690 [Nadsonia fulvescens var. elongata DSM 6958]